MDSFKGQRLLVKFGRLPSPVYSQQETWAVVGVVPFGLTFGSLVFRPEMPAARFIAVERIGAHQFSELEEVRHTAGFLERHD